MRALRCRFFCSERCVHFTMKIKRALVRNRNEFYERGRWIVICVKEMVGQMGNTQIDQQKYQLVRVISNTDTHGNKRTRPDIRPNRWSRPHAACKTHVVLGIACTKKTAHMFDIGFGRAGHCHCRTVTKFVSLHTHARTRLTHTHTHSDAHIRRGTCGVIFVYRQERCLRRCRRDSTRDGARVQLRQHVSCQNKNADRAATELFALIVFHFDDRARACVCVCSPIYRI